MIRFSTFYSFSRAQVCFCRCNDPVPCLGSIKLSLLCHFITSVRFKINLMQVVNIKILLWTPCMSEAGDVTKNRQTKPLWQWIECNCKAPHVSRKWLTHMLIINSFFCSFIHLPIKKMEAVKKGCYKNSWLNIFFVLTKLDKLWGLREWMNGYGVSFLLPPWGSLYFPNENSELRNTRPPVVNT